MLDERAEAVHAAERDGRVGRLPAGRHALFAYGTLTFPDVLRCLLGRVPERRAGSATGWRAAALPGRTYPGLVAGEGTVGGLVLLDLRPEEWWLIDAFEGDEYDLRPIGLDGGGRAWVYAWTDPGGVAPDDWDRGAFAAHHLAGFARRCAAWRAEMRGPR